jgi:hypothetical protein
MNFCNLTLADGRSTYVNLDRVCEILTMANDHTLVIFNDAASTSVLETPEQIISKA